MTKNYYAIRIDAMQNGYTLEASYKVRKEMPTEHNPNNYYINYKTDRFIFVDWADLTKFVNDNKLATPPADLDDDSVPVSV